MISVRHSKQIEDLVSGLEIAIGSNLPELIKLSEEFVTVRHDGEIIILGGLIPTSVMSFSYYIWLATNPLPSDPRSVLEGIRAGKKWLATIDRPVYGEVALGHEKGKKFAHVFGFKHLSHLDYTDRLLYEWRP